MDWQAALFTVLLLGGAWLGILYHRRYGRFLSRRKRWIAIAVGIYGFAVLTVIVIAGARF